VSRSFVAVSLLIVTACKAQTPPAAAAIDTTMPRTSVTMGGSIIVPRFVATWVRPAAANPSTQEALVMLRGGAMQFSNICTSHGVSWKEIPGDTLALTVVNGTVTAPVEQHFHIRELSDTALDITGDGYAAGRWTRAANPIPNSCPAP
jgi:hypothetical protein